jgi:hypothetical protein
MSGVAVIRYLLANAGTITAVVPAARIRVGDLPVTTDLPAVSVKQISSVPVNAIRMNETPKSHIDRVQVTAMFKATAASPAGTGYPGLRAFMKLLPAACPSQRGTINGVIVQSIALDAEGPDFHDDESGVHTCSRDFVVRWQSS